jgi:hypothetical protein
MADFDDPATFRGQLQRGRGIAARRAPGEPQAADAVYECVIHDPRWDRQTEARDTYLAALIQRLELPLGPIEQHLLAFDDDDPDDIGLLLDVLAGLALAGRQDAVGALQRYVAEGRHWSTALNALAFAGPEGTTGAWFDLVEDSLTHRTDAELQEMKDDGDNSWMFSLLERNPRIQAFFPFYADSHSAEQGQNPNAGFRDWLRTLTTAPREELLERVVNRTGRRRWALEELGRRQDQIVLDLLEDPGLRNEAGWIPGAVQALEHLGTAAVPRARIWAGGDYPLSELGIRVLAASGDHSDVPVLMAALSQAFDDADQWCAAEDPAQGLGRLRIAEAAPLLTAAWDATVHSHAREAFLAALRDCAPHAVETLAEEGLDDCEPRVRELAQTMSTPRRSVAAPEPASATQGTATDE